LLSLPLNIQVELLDLALSLAATLLQALYFYQLPLVSVFKALDFESFVLKVLHMLQFSGQELLLLRRELVLELLVPLLPRLILLEQVLIFVRF
jgi:hypothetical protein